SVVNISTLRYVAPPPASDCRAMAAGRRRSLGSGFVIDASGIIATNNHVIDGAAEINVTLNDETTYSATVLSKATKGDLALLKINPLEKLTPVRWADSDQVRPGQPVLAIGNPLGFGSSVSSGVVSALDRDIKSTPYDDYIQTDATINHGNSGGPLFDLDGRVVGINTALYSTTSDGGSIGIGFAIPANDAQFVIGRLLRYGRVRPGWVGIEGQQVTPEIAQALGLPRPRGVIVTRLEGDCPALAADVQEGDVVLQFAGYDIKDVRFLSRAMAIQPLGDSVPVVLWRGGQEIRTSVMIGENPADLRAAAADAAAAAAIEAARQARRDPLDLGLNLVPLGADARTKLRLAPDQKGVLVQGVTPSSPAAEQGMAPGDAILRIGRDPVASPAELRARIDGMRQDGEERLLLLVQGMDGRRWVALPAGTPAKPSPLRTKM
ncbi:MAG TPA: trypsin-like peptidase domain-containing protein, partial [Acetobacteraceae bacterium]